MKNLGILGIILLSTQICYSQKKVAEDFYLDAFNEIVSMFSNTDSLSIKRAVFLAEWAYYEGEIDYYKDYCDEINRIVDFVKIFYKINQFNHYKTGKQMSLNEYFFKPYSGNNYMPYLYDFENFSMEDDKWENQFVSQVLKTHKGQCRSLPWMYKILASEIGADVYITHAPRHTYITYRDDDNFTPEDWINLELTTHQMQPSFWIKQNFAISDSAVLVGTYMKPLNDVETVACQLADLAFGYFKKFKRYDEFTYYCSAKSLEYYPMNPTALIIMGKSLDCILQNHLKLNEYCADAYAYYLSDLIFRTKHLMEELHLTLETSEIRELRRQQTIEAEKYTNENLIPK